VSTQKTIVFLRFNKNTKIKKLYLNNLFRYNADSRRIRICIKQKSDYSSFY